MSGCCCPHHADGGHSHGGFWWPLLAACLAVAVVEHYWPQITSLAGYVVAVAVVGVTVLVGYHLVGEWKLRRLYDRPGRPARLALPVRAPLALPPIPPRALPRGGGMVIDVEPVKTRRMSG